MKACIRLLAILFLLLTPIHADRAFIAFDRTLHGDLVQGRNLTVTYTLHNVGDRTATDIILRDNSFPASRFSRFDSSVGRWQWNKIEASESKSVSTIILPKRHGVLHVPPASVQYKHEQNKFTSKLSTEDTIIVEELLTYRRKHDKHSVDWSAFAIAFVLLVVGPAGVSNLVQKSIPNSNTQKKKN